VWDHRISPMAPLSSLATAFAALAAIPQGVDAVERREALPWAGAANASAGSLVDIVQCVDSHTSCEAWSRSGECSKNPGFMASSCRRSCGKCALSGEDALKAREICHLAARNLLGLHHSLLTGGQLADDSSMSKPPASLVHARVRELMVESLNLLERCGSDHADPNAAFIELAAAIQASVDATCGAGAAGTGAGEEPECAPPPSQEDLDAIAAAAAARLSGMKVDTHFAMLRGLDGQLNVKMPLIGLGTWLTTGIDCEKLVTDGLKAGLRAIDTSENYLNADAIGRAIAASNVPRGELFLASKLSHANSYSTQGARESLQAQLDALGTDYLDLFMLHSVGPSTAARREAWREMRAMQSEGLVRSIGVSNFHLQDLKSLVEEDSDDGGQVVAMLQNKFNPYHQGSLHTSGDDYPLFCRDHNITLIAYCPLNAWPSALAPINDVFVSHVAVKVDRTPAQVLLRWALQRGAAVLTRSSKEAHLQEAVAVYDFELSSTYDSIVSGLGWLALSKTNRPPPSVADVLGIQQAEKSARSLRSMRNEL